MKTTELKRLRDKCLFFNKFMMDSGSIPLELIRSFVESNGLIEEAYQKGKLRPLKNMSVNIDNQIMKHIPLPMALELKAFFRKNLNMDLEAVDNAQQKAIGKVLKKGKVSTSEEYELLLYRIYEIKTDSNRQKEVNLLNELLSGFDKKVISI